MFCDETRCVCPSLQHTLLLFALTLTGMGDARMKILFENMDTDKDGIVDFAEFLAALEGQRRWTHLLDSFLICILRIWRMT